MRYQFCRGVGSELCRGASSELCGDAGSELCRDASSELYRDAGKKCGFKNIVAPCVALESNDLERLVERGRHNA